MSNNLSNNIFFDQTLHGYKDGHSLISSSLDLNSEVRRLMLIMSDMSGNSMVSGYEDYLTGYQVKDMNMYALAKTWSAPEMERPGCVWTHTILIKFPDLIKINSKQQLLSLFQRPSEFFDIDDYSNKIELPKVSSGNKIDGLIDFNNGFIKAVYFDLYSKPDIPVLIQERNRKDYEDLVLSIWMQQWPRLRRNFSFCTGAISPRTINSKLLDLQITPAKRETSSNKPNGVSIIDSNRILALNEETDWIDIATNDLQNKSNSSLRSFFINYGSDLKPDRSSFKPLIELYSLIYNSSEVSTTELFNFIGNTFPTINEANGLKAAILNGELQDRTLNVESLKDHIIALSTIKQYKAFNLNKNFISERVHSLYEADFIGTLDVLSDLLKKDINPIGIEILRIVADYMSNKDISNVKGEYRKLLLVFAQLNPHIAYQNAFWEVRPSEQKENLALLVRISREQNIDWQKILNILIELDADVELENIEGVTSYTLTCINSNPLKMIRARWINLLKIYPAKVLEWLSQNNVNNTELLKVLIFVLNPNSKEVNKFGCSIWIKMLTSNINLDKTSKNRLNAFCVALGLNSKTKESRDLLELCAQPVYTALAQNELDYDSWRFIEIHTQALNFWQDWDKSRKLLNALAEKFITNKWPVNDFEKIFRDKAALNYLIYYYHSVR